MKIIDCEQGSAEWFAARCGKVTASRVADLTAKTKSGYSASRANYMAELVAERLTGSVAERHVSSAMEWGTAHEGAARTMYEFMADAAVKQVGIVLHPSIEMAAASPDGLVADTGLVEIKCPNTATHIETLLGAEIDGRYVKQMQWQMACTGRAWCDFVSFEPRMPADMQIHITRVARSDDVIADLEGEVRAFLAEAADKVDRLLARFRAEVRDVA